MNVRINQGCGAEFWTERSPFFSSDHSPWNYADKIAGGPNTPFNEVLNGIPGIETRLPLFFSATQTEGRLSVNQFVDITTTTPAKLYGLYPRKGVIAVGSDADLAIWDPHKTVVIRNEMLHHAVDHTPYEGMQVRGWPNATLCSVDALKSPRWSTRRLARGLLFRSI